MSENCNSDYYNIFMTQLVKTFAQLTAGVLSVSVTAPVYNYYLKTFATQNNHTEQLDSDLEVEDRETEYEAEEEEENQEGEENQDVEEGEENNSTTDVDSVCSKWGPRE
jgi:uncharacterized membrane protein YcgQ (UPF0703/DUF1980 family)